jgi:hypothetical protein
VLQHEVRDHRLKRTVGNRESFCIAEAEVELWMEPRGKPHHPFGDIHSNDRCATLGCSSGCMPRSAGHVQQAHVGTHGGGVKQRLNKAASDRTEEIVVSRSSPTPPGRLKRRERFLVNGRHLLRDADPMTPSRIVAEYTCVQMPLMEA